MGIAPIRKPLQGLVVVPSAPRTGEGPLEAANGSTIGSVFYDNIESTAGSELVTLGGNNQVGAPFSWGEANEAPGMLGGGCRGLRC